jgi:hypothetical protein
MIAGYVIILFGKPARIPGYVSASSPMPWLGSFGNFSGKSPRSIVNHFGCNLKISLPRIPVGRNPIDPVQSNLSYTEARGSALCFLVIVDLL